jgi:hypothetical protein
MESSPLYEPLELLRDDGIRTFSARETSSGKIVLLYVFAGAQPQTTQELLGQIQVLKERRITELIDTGVNEGVPFVVTDYLAPVVSLREWVLTQMERYGVPMPTGSLDYLTRVGRWKVPVAPPAAPAPAATHSPEPQLGPGEFTRMFQAGAPLAPSGEPALPPVAAQAATPEPAFSHKPQSGPGEFTRMFQAGAPPAPIGEPVMPPVAVHPATPVAPPVTPPTPAVPAQPQTGPGEFTRMFQAGAPPAPIGETVTPPVVVQGAPPAGAFPPQPQASPGEFTRYFSAPLPSSVPVSGSSSLPQFPAPSPFLKADPSPPAASFAPPGEFTRIFGKSDLGAIPSSPMVAPPPTLAAGYAAAPPGGSAAPSFPPAPQLVPQFPAPAATPIPQPTGAPGDYTRMFGPQPRPIKPAPAPVQAPHRAPFRSPGHTAGQARKQSVLSLILLLAGLVLVALLVIVVFALNK